MTVEQMMDRGIIVDGTWGFKKWDEDNARYIHIPKEKGLFMQVTYIYAEDGMLVIEVE